MKKTALTVAGSDPSGGAGLQADLKTFHQFGVYGMSVVTLLTVQNTMGVKEVQVAEPSLVTAQLKSVLEDIPPGAAKTGALGNAEVICAVAEIMKSTDFPWVVDPVMISKNGQSLLASAAVEEMKRQILPHALLAMPNIHEAESLTGMKLGSDASFEEAAAAICGLGASACLIKGGHRSDDANDFFYTKGRSEWFRAKRVDTRNTHGTGCTYSAAVTALLAEGADLFDAVGQAKSFISEAILDNPGLGHGHGPLNHHVRV